MKKEERKRKARRCFVEKTIAWLFEQHYASNCTHEIEVLEETIQAIQRGSFSPVTMEFRTPKAFCKDVPLPVYVTGTEGLDMGELGIVTVFNLSDGRRVVPTSDPIWQELGINSSHQEEGR